MDETAIVIMLKDEKTGVLTTELATLSITEHEEYLVNVYAVRTDAQAVAHVKVSTGREVTDWEFDAVYDYYDEEALRPFVLGIEEVEDCYEPTWELTMAFSTEEIDAFTLALSDVLARHKAELDDVFATIQDKEDEYKNNL